MKRFIFLNLTVILALVSSCQKENGLSEPTFSFSVDMTGSETFKFLQSRTFQINSKSLEKVDFLAPKGWTVNLTGDAVEVISPAWGAPQAEYSGRIELRAVARDNRQDDITIACDVNIPYTAHTITFEEVDARYLAGPTAYGSNLYSTYPGTMPAKQEGYSDETSGLFFHSTTTGNGFAAGGIAISQWNDKSTAGHLNQCSVYSGDDGRYNGGNNSSATFAASFTSSRDNSGAYMFFNGDGKVCYIDHAYFTNNTYAALSMTYGDQFAHAHTYDNRDWFKLIIIGEDKNGEETGRTECYLSDFRRPESGGILKEWKKIDLTPLGRVHKVLFKMESSDGQGYWMNTPAYFCMDDITVIVE